MASVSVVIHSYNSEKEIEECVKSARLLTDDVIVVDMESQDATVQKAKKAGARVVSFPPSLYVEPAREFGIRQSKSDWVFILDSDERMTKELAHEIKASLQSTSDGYFRIPRKNIFGHKKWLKHGGWWPDEQIRLIRLASFKSWPRRIHSTPDIGGSFGTLKEPLLHYFHGDLKTMVNKTQVFEQIEANLLYEADRPVSVVIFFRKFFGELFRRLVKRIGFLDGTVGIIESVYQAYSKTITYLYLYEKKKSRTV